jgi:serpin B
MLTLARNNALIKPDIRRCLSMRIMRLAVFTCILALLSCQDNAGLTSKDDVNGQENTPVRPAGEINDSLVTANTAFGFKLFGELAQEYDGQNLFVSPPSVAIALAMTYNGAAGTTRDAMARTLELQGMDLDAVNSSYADLLTILANPDSAVELSIANSLWARQGLPFKDDFLQRNQDFYHAEVAALDFGDPDAAPTINGWVSDKTRGKIREIVDDPINSETILFLINAIYFKGIWTYEFADSLTEDRPFTLLDGSVKQNPTMHQSGDYRYLRGDGFQAVSLPYGTRRLSMYVFLPEEGSSLSEFQRSLTAENWREWMAEFRTTEGDIALPRFRLEYEASLVTALRALGMGVAFDPFSADFSEMFPVSAAANVFISNVKHKTFVEVNEQGTEAAAVTSVEVGVTAFEPGPPPQRFSMIVDRPFFFAIRDDRTGLTLFMGSIVEPL